MHIGWHRYRHLVAPCLRQRRVVEFRRPVQSAFRSWSFPVNAVQRHFSTQPPMNGLAKRISMRYRHLCSTWPWAMAFSICFLKGAAADTFAQKAIEKRAVIDERRTLGLALFSGAYCGCAQHFVFNVAFTWILGTCTKLPTAIKKTFLDFLGHAPFLYLPTYLAFDEFLRFETLRGLWDRIQVDLWNTWCAYIKVWPPVMMFCFTIVPVELRVTCLACVSVVWLMILSCVAH